MSKFWDHTPDWIFIIFNWRKIKKARRFCNSEEGKKFINKLKEDLENE